MKTAFAVLFAALSLSAQQLPNPEILKQQAEAQERERAVARRIDYQVSHQVKPTAPAPAATPAPHLTPAELQQLREALDTYFRENPGVIPVFWTPSQEAHR